MTAPARTSQERAAAACPHRICASLFDGEAACASDGCVCARFLSQANRVDGEVSIPGWNLANRDPVGPSNSGILRVVSIACRAFLVCAMRDAGDVVGSQDTGRASGFDVAPVDGIVMNVLFVEKRCA